MTKKQGWIIYGIGIVLTFALKRIKEVENEQITND